MVARLVGTGRAEPHWLDVMAPRSPVEVATQVPGMVRLDVAQ
jgi:hypothetical protein